MKKGNDFWIVVGFILAVLGGLLGIIMGANYAFGNYDEATKKKGKIMLGIGIFTFIVWRVIALQMR